MYNKDYLIMILFNKLVHIVIKSLYELSFSQKFNLFYFIL